MAIRNKRHTVTAFAATEADGRRDYADTGTDVRGLFVTGDVDRALRTFGPSTSATSLFFCDPADGAYFADGYRVLKGTVGYLVTEDPIIGDDTNAADHAIIPLRRQQFQGAD